MPIYTIRDPKTDKIVKLEGNRPPTEQELIKIFDSLALKQETNTHVGFEAYAPALEEKKTINVPEGFVLDEPYRDFYQVKTIENKELWGEDPTIPESSLTFLSTGFALLAIITFITIKIKTKLISEGFRRLLLFTYLLFFIPISIGEIWEIRDNGYAFHVFTAMIASTVIYYSLAISIAWVINGFKKNNRPSNRRNEF